MNGFYWWVLAVLAYFLPGICAVVRKCKYQNGIAVLNLFTGWTVVGWIAALIWAASAPPENPRATA